MIRLGCFGDGALRCWAVIYGKIFFLESADDPPRRVRVITNNHDDPWCPGPSPQDRDL